MAQVVRGGHFIKPEKKAKAAKKAKAKKAAKPKKAKAAKKAAAPKRPRKMSRQLNDKELKVAGLLIKRRQASLEEMAEVFPKKGTTSRTKGNSWVRNSLRKLLTLKIAKKAGKGTYQALVTKLPSEATGAEPKKARSPKPKKEAKPKKVAKPRKAKAAKPEEPPEPNGVGEAPSPGLEPVPEAAAE